MRGIRRASVRRLCCNVCYRGQGAGGLEEGGEFNGVLGLAAGEGVAG